MNHVIPSISLMFLPTTGLVSKLELLISSKTYMLALGVMLVPEL